MISIEVDEFGRNNYFHPEIVGKLAANLIEGNSYQSVSGCRYKVKKVHSHINTGGLGSSNYVWVDIEPVS